MNVLCVTSLCRKILV